MSTVLHLSAGEAIAAGINEIDDDGSGSGTIGSYVSETLSGRGGAGLQLFVAEGADTISLLEVQARVPGTTTFVSYARFLPAAPSGTEVFVLYPGAADQVHGSGSGAPSDADVQVASLPVPLEFRVKVVADIADTGSGSGSAAVPGASVFTVHYTVLP